MMVCHKPGCVGNYDFDEIAFFAKRRYVDGCNTMELMQAASSEREKEEIALVSLLDVRDDEIRQIQLCCRHAGRCKIIDCREQLKGLIEKQLGKASSP